jgi:hypothetical protein
MWKPFKCRLFRDHDYDVRREPGALFLQCKRCGKRSDGWNLRRDGVNRDSPLRLVFAESDGRLPATPASDEGAPGMSPVMADGPEIRLRFNRLL